MTNITLTIISKNESENIKNNFDWLDNCPVINEIIVIDDYSEDDSQQLFKKLVNKDRKVRIFKKHLHNNFAKQKNLAVSKSSNDWILNLDCDEKPSLLLQNFLKNFDFKSDSNFAFKRTDIFLGQKLHHGETANQYFIRLFNKNNGKFIHSVHEIWHSNRSTINKNFEILHSPHQSLKSFLNKINYYTDIRSQELYQQRYRTSLFQIFFYPIGKFIVNYIFKLGFLDSTAGIILAIGMSFHSFLVRAKLWHLYQK